MRRVLFLAHRIPFPPDKGDKIRSFHELKILAASGHEVHLLAFADDPRDLRADYKAALSELCASVSILALNRRLAAAKALVSLARGRPFTLGYFSARSMREAVARTLASTNPDAIVVYCSSVAQYVPPALYSRTLLDMVDVDSEKWRDYSRAASPPRAWIYATEAKRLRAYEQSIIRRIARTIVTTSREAATLVDGADDVRARVATVPSGVDLTRFSTALAADSDARAAQPCVVFTGAMDYYANVDAARYFVHDVWPAIRSRVPDAQFVIVGSNPSSSVLALASTPGVSVTGTVPDVRPYVGNAVVSVAPLRIARGVQNKILEAMSMGRAVVSTPQAAAGLAAAAGEELLVASGATALADAVVSLLNDPDLRARIGRRARAFVERNHDWPITLRRFVEIVDRLAG